MLASQARGGLCRAVVDEHRFPKPLGMHPRTTVPGQSLGRSLAKTSSTPSHTIVRNALILGGDGGKGGGNGSGKRITGEDDDDNRSSGSSIATACLLLGLFSQALFAPPAKALKFRKKKKNKNNQMIDEYSDRLVNLGWPIAQNLGFSGAIGFMSGLALKVIGQAVAVAFGLLFVIIQGGVYLGYIEVKWAEVHKEVIKRLDINRDGKFDASDAKSLAASGLAVLSQGVPSVGGFLAGFALALR